MDDEMLFIAWPFLIPIVAIIGGITYSIINSNNRARIRELEIRKQIAMIEKGMAPPPEVNPAGFERAMRRDEWDDYHHARPGRLRRAGVTLIGVGFGLMFMLTMIAARERVGIGVGGFLVILGFVFFLNGLFDRGGAPARRD